MERETKFKEGDRIRLTKLDSFRIRLTKSNDIEVGMLGTVIKNINPPQSIAIDLDVLPRHYGIFGEGWWVSPKEIELAKD